MTIDDTAPTADGETERDTAFWNEVEAVFSDAVELAGDAQAALIDGRCGGRTMMRAEIESLLAVHRRAHGFMQHPTVSHDGDAVRELQVGDVVGQFKLADLIAVGGMGTVYRAERADGAFAHQVAVKIISAPLTRDDVKRRFLAERQILASLHHPNIVSLLDAGLTADGQAYLVMELVDGLPITTYCRQRQMGVDERLRLFRDVCNAVHYAHAHFVVHRDLKPANVLVTSDGVPKVLDFGIAELLEGPLANRGTLERRGDPLTPSYASPEQLGGGRVTSGADIYALGMVLFELLTGTRPYDVSGRSLAQVVELVASTPTVRPSDARPETDAKPPYDWRGTLRGDLDAITLRACHRDPGQRYASADALSQDLRRYLAHEPVEARKSAFFYVLRKLAERHRVAFTAAALSAVVVIAALAIAIRQARLATTQEQRATRRFNEVRQLANALIFKIDDAVAPLAGSTPVRQAIVGEGLTYLERLAPESAGDHELQLELARGYLKIGQVQGRPNTANLGDLSGAVTTFAKAQALLGPLADAPRAPADVLANYIDAIRFGSESLNALGGSTRHDESHRAATLAVAEAERLARARPDLDARRFVAAAEFQMALLSDEADALPHWQKAETIYEALSKEHPDELTWQRNIALVDKYLMSYYEHLPDLPAAFDHTQRALAIDQRRVDRAPKDRVAQLDLAIDFSNVAHLHLLQKEYEPAFVASSQSLAIRQQLLATDAKDVRARDRVAYAHRQLGSIRQAQGDGAAALRHYRDSIAEYERTNLTIVRSKADVGATWLSVGNLERRAGRSQEACDAYRRALDYLRPLTERERTSAETNSEDPLPYATRMATACGAPITR